VVQGAPTAPDTLTLAAEAKLGSVTFSHTRHAGTYKDAAGQAITCVACHHTAQPAADVAKTPGMKTAWPADRTTTLSAEVLASNPSAAPGACRDCHARTGVTPKHVAEIPQFTPAGASAPVTLNNQQAFHRNCASCHDAVLKARADAKAPGTSRCLMCHKK
jgi:hypothetical protein